MGITLQLATSNPADILRLTGKGHIQEGFAADILILDTDFRIVQMMANGKKVKQAGYLY